MVKTQGASTKTAVVKTAGCGGELSLQRSQQALNKGLRFLKRSDKSQNRLILPLWLRKGRRAEHELGSEKQRRKATGTPR